VQQLLDVSDLPPPEPLERVLDALADLPAGDSLKVRLPMEPVLLYSMLRSMGLAWERNAEPGGTVELVIWEPRI
jgi:TusA-related sulfurtransferase